MANNYTQASFTILCSQEQAQMALDAIAYVTDTDVAGLRRTITSLKMRCGWSVWAAKTTCSSVRIMEESGERCCTA